MGLHSQFPRERKSKNVFWGVFPYVLVDVGAGRGLVSGFKTKIWAARFNVVISLWGLHGESAVYSTCPSLEVCIIGMQKPRIDRE